MDGFLFDTSALPVLEPQKKRTRRRGAPRGPVATPLWALDDAITVVLFAGLGGACQGLEEAGLPVHVANNHDEVALAAHAAIHPHTKHIRGDIFDVDPLVATGRRRVKVLWASPDCRDHSSAKGGAPRSPRVRSLPWQVCRWAGKTEPNVIFVENVREIRGWGPLVAKRDKATGRVLKLVEVPDPKRRGKTKRIEVVAEKGEHVPVQQQVLVRDKKRLGRSFRRWKAHMQTLGYAYDDRDLNCADFGVPTARRRFFAVMRRDGQPIRWPERTHAPHYEAQALGLLPWVPAWAIIDWSLDLPSIFGRDQELAEATKRRVATGLKRFVLEHPSPFLIHLTHHGERSVHPIHGSVPTITSAHRGELALVAPHLTKFNENSPGQPSNDPIHTLMAGAARFGVVGAFLEEHRTKSVGQDVATPLGTQTQADHHSVVGAYLTRYHGEKRPGEARGIHPHDPVAVQTVENRFGVVGAFMVQHNTGVIGHHMTDSLSTLTTIGTQQQVAAAYLTEFRGTSRDGQSVADAAPTMCTGGGKGGGHTGVCAAFLHHQYSTGTMHQEAVAPLATQSTKDRTMVTGAMLEVPPLSPEDYARARRVAEFLRTYSDWDGGEVATVTIGGVTSSVTDVGMRMLKVFEAAAAHELTLPKLIRLPKRDRAGNLVIDQQGNILWIVRELTKTEGMKLVGNSVPKRMARLLAAANDVHTLYAPSSRQLQAAE